MLNGSVICFRVAKVIGLLLTIPDGEMQRRSVGGKGILGEGEGEGDG